MARNTNIKLRRSATHGAIPTTSNLDLGELALNTYDGKLYAKTTEGSASEVIQVGSATDSYHKIRKSLTLTFTVTVASKTTDHAFHGSGSSSGYFIDGLQSPHLHLVPGNTYRFDVSDSSNSGHPFRFYYEADKTTSYTAGVTTNGTAGTSGAYVQIVPTESTPPVLFYQCSSHGYMGNRADFGTRNLTGFDTDDLSEGSSNLYYTDARAQSAAQAVSINNVVEDTTPQLGGNLASNGNDILFADNDKAIFGAGSDLQIYHDGSNSRIQDLGTGSLFIDGQDRVNIRRTSNGNFMGSFIAGGAVELYYNAGKKFETTDVGIKVTGNIANASGDFTLDAVGDIILDADGGEFKFHDGGTESLVIGKTGGSPYIYPTAQDSDLIILGNDGGSQITALTLDMSASGAATFNDQITLGGNLIHAGNLTIDAGGDIDLDADGGDIFLADGGTRFAQLRNSSNSLRIDTLIGDADIIFRGIDGSSTITALTLDMSDAGTAIFNHDIKLANNGKALFGSTLEISSDGTQSNIRETGTGDLQVFGDNINFFNVAGNHNLLNLIDGAEVRVFYNGSQKLATTNTGIDVTGEVKGDSLDIDGVGDISGNLAVGGNLTLTGNLTVNGTTTTVSSTNTQITDALIELGNGTSGSPLNDAGLVIERGSSDNVFIGWDESNDRVAVGTGSFTGASTGNLSFTRASFAAGAGDFSSISSSGNITGNLVGNVTGTVSSLSNHDTGDLTEGSNLYYTNARADARIAAASIDDLSDVDITTNAPSSGQVLKWDGSNFVPSADLSGSAASNSFATISVSGQSNVVADSSTDTLTLVAGNNITLTTNASTDTITVAASGGEVTVQDEGTSLSTAASTLNFVGAGVTASGTGATKTITIAGTGTVTEAFKTIAVSGSSDIVADSATDTLTLVAGSGMTITNNASSDTITFASSGGASQSGVFTEYTFTATSNQTTFSGSDDNSATLSYNASAVQVFLNGVLQENGTDYTASNGTSVVLVNAANSGDILQVSAYTQVLGFGDSALSELTGDGSTTAFTIAANPNHENNTQVYIDGVYQEKGTYSVSGTTLTFSSAPPSGTSIEVVIGSRNVTVDDVSGLTADSLTVDTITIDGSEIDATGNLTIDAVGDIILDADGGDVILRDGGTSFLTALNSSGDAVLTSNVDDKDIIFKGYDNGSLITALTLDMSDAGTAIFNKDINIGDDNRIYLGASSDLQIYHDASNGVSRIVDAGTGDLKIQGTNIQFRNSNDSAMYARYTNGGAAELYHNGSKKFETTSGGASITGDLAVSGDLTISGTTTTLNTATLDVEDKNITLNYGSGDTSSTADGAGITIQDAVNSSTNATILWDASNDEFDFSHALNVAGNVTLSSGSDIKSPDNFAIYDTGGSLDRFAFSTNSFYNVREGGYHRFTTHASGGSLVETLRLQNNRVQINNSSSIDNNSQLHITGYSSGHAGITMQDVDVTNGKTFFKQTSGTTEIQTQNGSSHGVFKITGWNGSASAEFMRVNSNGRVGIGTSAPDFTIDARDDANIQLKLASTSSSYNSRMVFAPNNSIKWNMGVNVSDSAFTWYDQDTSTVPVRFEVGAATNTLVVDATSRIGIGTNSPGVSLDVGSKTDAIRVPNGTTAQRPTAATGQLRYNTTTSEFEGYTGSSWGAIGGGGDAFGTIAVSGQSNVVADQENDTLTLVGQNGVTITTNASSDTVTFDASTSYNPFTTDLFTTANNSTTDFVLSKTPSSEDNLIVFLEGVYQNKNSYSLSSNTLTLDAAPASGEEVVVHIVGDVITGEALTRNNFTGDGSTTDFTLTLAPMNENNCYVYSDGVYQEKSEFSVSGTTLSFGSAPASGASLEVLIPKATQINQPSTGSIDDAAMYDTTAILPQTVTSTTVASTSATTIATHSASTYRTIKYLVQCTQGTDYHSTEINLIHDGSTVYITEYGTLYDNAALGTFDATISGGNILLKITAGSATSMGVKVVSSAVPV